ncbi:MAG: flavodoxin family protein [Candidatus Hodarchaeota archaeon]
MGKVKIKMLGISSSPRKNYNTDTSVKAALDSAKMLGDWVETEFINVTNYEIKPCISCIRCYMEGTRERPCPGINDDMNTEIYPRLLDADVYLVGTPVYWGTLNAQAKTWMDRCLPFCHGSNSELRGALSKKVCGAIVTSWDVHGGTEITIETIHSWAHVLDITIASAGHHHPHGVYLGGAAYTQPHMEKTGWKHDIFGARSIRGTAKRATELALFLKLGMEKVKEDEAIYSRPEEKGKGKVEIDWDAYFKVQPHFPTIHYRVPEVLATSKVAFEKYIEWMDPKKFKERRGEAFGQEAGAKLDRNAFKETWTEKLKVKFIDDEELYNYDPEFFGQWLKK